MGIRVGKRPGKALKSGFDKSIAMLGRDVKLKNFACSSCPECEAEAIRSWGKLRSAHLLVGCLGFGIALLFPEVMSLVEDFTPNAHGNITLAAQAAGDCS